MTAKIYDINELRKAKEKQEHASVQALCDELEDNCIDDLVEEWGEVLHRKLVEIYDNLGPSAAYQFHHRLCGTEISVSRDIVNIIVDLSL